MSSDNQVTPQAAAAASHHGRRVFLLWLVLSLIAVPIVVLVWGPHLPPQGSLSEQAQTQHEANIVMSGAVTPVVVLILVFFPYAMSRFRHRGDELTDGPYIVGHTRLQATWVGVTALIVLTVAAFGTVELLGPAAGAGGGQGPVPLAKPSGSSMDVQVIAQQWGFTFRYPSYNGVETYRLAIPADTNVAFHVTSIDVIHSFWAYQLGVKADANPGVDNVAYVKARRPGNFTVRCSELCGLWHAFMTNHGQVLSKSDFAAWISQQQQQEAPLQKSLPPYSLTYNPDPPRRAG